MTPGEQALQASDTPNPPTVSFHNFKSQNVKLSVSNPKSKYVAYSSVLSQISNCQGLGRRNNHDILKTDRTNIVDFRGFDSSIILIPRGGIPRPIADFPESLSQAMLVGCNVSREIGRRLPGPLAHHRHLYTSANTWLQYLVKHRYTVL